MAANCGLARIWYMQGLVYEHGYECKVQMQIGSSINRDLASADNISYFGWDVVERERVSNIERQTARFCKNNRIGTI